MYEAVYRRIARGDMDQLPALLPDLVQSALLPYVGDRAASAYRAQMDAAVPGSPA